MKETESDTAQGLVDLRLLKHGVHFLSDDLTPENLTAAIRWITYENLTKSTKPLTLVINTVGGLLYDSFALIDMMRASRRPVRTIGLGNVMSCGFMIFVAGQKGHRYIGANTGIMCHQYAASTEGKHHELKASLQEGEMCNLRMEVLLQEATGLSAAKIRTKLLRETDTWLTPQEMISLGAADYILESSHLPV